MDYTTNKGIYEVMGKFLNNTGIDTAFEVLRVTTISMFLSNT